MAKNEQDNYWVKQFERIKLDEMQLADDCKANLKEVFEEALQKCQKDVESWYQRYADENGLSYADAQKVLNARELKAFKMDLKTYQKLAKTDNLSPEYQKMLAQASIRARLTRAQELMIKTQAYVEKVAKQQEIDITDTLKKVYEDSNYKAAYEIQRMKGQFDSFAQIPEKQIEKAITTRWALDEKNFPERIWGNRDKLASTLQNEITKSLLLKEGTTPMTKRISDAFNVSWHNASKLVETETAYVQEAAMLDVYDELDIDQYQICATLDNRTTPLCRKLDGEVFATKDFKPGVTAPPFHCYCRTTTIPFIPGVTDAHGQTRAARDPITGKTVFVDAGLTYPEWKKKYVDGVTPPKPQSTKKPKAPSVVQSVKDDYSKMNVLKLATDVIGFHEVTDEFKNAGLNEEITRPSLLRIQELEDKFGVIHQSFVSFLDAKNDGRNTIAYVSYQYALPTKETFSMCKRAFSKKLEDWIKDKERDVAKHWFMPCSKDKLLVYIVTHEYGHMIQNELVKRAYEADGWKNDPAKAFDFIDMTKKTTKARFKWYITRRNQVQTQCYNEIIAIAKTIAEKDGREFDLDKSLSRYGKTNKAEFFAEVFANSQCGEPNDLGKAMNMWLEAKGLVKK